MLNPFWRAIPAVCLLAIVFAIHAVTFAEDTATAEEGFSVVLLPDTQNYSEKFPDTYVAQALWIRQQAKEDNIKFVVHLGDIVQTSTKKPEWENADRAMRLLDGVVPYSMAPGNHDMVVKNRDSTLYNQYYSPARFAGRKWYGGHLGETNDNNYCFFEASGMKFMIINLEFAPRDETAICVRKSETQPVPRHTKSPATAESRCGRSSFANSRISFWLSVVTCWEWDCRQASTMLAARFWKCSRIIRGSRTAAMVGFVR
jgi:hypothetical protein